MAKRPLLLGLAVLLLATPLAGCFERNGTLTIELAVSDTGAIRDFRSLNLTFHRVSIDARSLNPEPFPADTTRLELAAAARNDDRSTLFSQQVRADQYTKITVTTPVPPDGFRGTLLNGTTVGVVVPNNAIIVQTDFEVPRGGSVTYLFTIRVERAQSGEGSPVYTVVADRDASRVV